MDDFEDPNLNTGLGNDLRRDDTSHTNHTTYDTIRFSDTKLNEDLDQETEDGGNVIKLSKLMYLEMKRKR